MGLKTTMNLLLITSMVSVSGRDPMKSLHQEIMHEVSQGEEPQPQAVAAPCQERPESSEHGEPQQEASTAPVEEVPQVAAALTEEVPIPEGYVFDLDCDNREDINDFYKRMERFSKRDGKRRTDVALEEIVRIAYSYENPHMFCKPFVLKATGRLIREKKVHAIKLATVLRGYCNHVVRKHFKSHRENNKDKDLRSLNPIYWSYQHGWHKKDDIPVDEAMFFHECQAALVIPYLKWPAYHSLLWPINHPEYIKNHSDNPTHGWKSVKAAAERYSACLKDQKNSTKVPTESEQMMELAEADASADAQNVPEGDDSENPMPADESAAP